MKVGRVTPFSRCLEMLAPVIDQTFDFTTILKAPVGITWNSPPHDRQATLLKAFRHDTIAPYVNGFNEDDEHFVVNPEPKVTGNEQVVRTRVIVRVGDESELDHVMRQGPAG